MTFKFTPMTIEYAEEIKKWKYDGVVKSIYVKPYFESYNKETGEMFGPGGCKGYGVVQENELIGLFEYYLNDEIIEIGLALSPKVVGKGMGKDFVLQGIAFGVKEFDYKEKHIKLSVNKENKPAIRVYEKAGFIKVKEDEDIEMHKYL